MLTRKKSIRILFSSIGLASLALVGCKDEAIPLYPGATNPAVDYSWGQTADSLQQRTNEVYLTTNGRYYRQSTESNTFHYWWNAHMLDVMADGYERTGNESYVTRMRALLNGIRETNNGVYPNDFYDDMEWLALASLRAYQQSQEEVFREAVAILWQDILTGLNDNQGGGIAWKKDQLAYKNTPANAPAIILACRLYTEFNDPNDLEIAKDLYNWLKSTLVDPVNGLVWDGINRNGDGQIDKNWIFTYTQGVFIGAAHELYKVTGDRSYLNDALKTAHTSILHPEVTTAGILKNENQSDGGLFKGIMIRYLALLAADPSLNDADRKTFLDFIKFNAETAYSKALSRPDLFFSPDWQRQPEGTIDLSTQLSGLMLIEAASFLFDQ